MKKLLDIMARLRSPEDGCPWDLKQTSQTIASYAVEEAYELTDAIERQDINDIKDELGDLLFQIVFHSQIAKEKKIFDFHDVVEQISDKMVRRHPHVFGDYKAKTDDEISKMWEDIKRKENKQRIRKPQKFLDDIPSSFPAMQRAFKLQKKAATIGFDWPNVSFVIDKISEELEETKEALNQFDQPQEASSKEEAKKKLEEEIGDLLFVIVNLARHRRINPETALRQANAKFIKRFHFIEDELLNKGSSLQQADLAEMDALWDLAKENEN